MNTKKEPLSHNQETEASILGGIILDPSVINKVKLIIKPEYFSVKPWGRVYQILLKIAVKGGIDPVILRQDLENKNIDIGGSKAIASWTSIAVTATNTVHHAKRLAAQWKSQKLEDICYKSLDEISASEDIGDICQKITRSVDKLSTNHSDTIPSAQAIIDLNRHGDTCPPITTGYQALDDYFGGGVDRGSVTIIAGATSIGKSQFSVNVTTRSCKSQTRCLYIVQEMNIQAMEDRFISTISKIPQKACKVLRTGTAKKSTVEKYSESYNEALEQFAKLPLRVKANGTITATDLENIVATHHKELDLVVLDYLQQCRASYSNQESRERVDEVSRMCKHLAAKYNIAIIALAQISREGTKASVNSSNGRPKSWHLKESSSIEQDADYVIILHRERAKSAKAEVLELDICKNRHGETGKLYFMFDLENGVIFDPKDNT